MIRWAMPLVLAALLLGAAPVHAGTIVFDFEDGLQGWELGGSAQRVQTQLLGGEWAIFGDGLLVGGASLRQELDLTGLGSVSWDQRVLEGDLRAVSLRISRLDPESGAEVSLLLFDLILGDPPPFIPGPLPPILGVHAGFSPLGGVWTAEFQWQAQAIGPEPGPISRFNVAFIDNITFHTIPEPSALGMLVVGGVAAVARRRAQGRRHM